MSVNVIPDRLQRWPYWTRICFLFPLKLATGYMALAATQNHGPNLTFVDSMVVFAIAVTLTARFRDIGWSGPLGFVLAALVMVIAQMLPVMRLDWVQERGLTRSTFELMIPHTIIAYAILALLIIAAGLFKSNPKRVLDRCNRMIERRPERAHRYLERGRAYLDFGNFDAAIADFDKAIALDANISAAYGARDLAQLRKTVAQLPRRRRVRFRRNFLLSNPVAH